MAENKMEIGKVEFSYKPEAIHRHLVERKQLEFKRIREVLELYKIDENTINGILAELQRNI